MVDDPRPAELAPLAPLPRRDAVPLALQTPPPASARVRRMAVVLVTATTLCGAVGTALSPVLLVSYPEWLIALSPDMRHFVLTATSLDLQTALLIGVPRRVLGMFSAWALGAAYGAAALGFIEGRYPRLLKVVRFIERVFLRTGPVLLLAWPSYTLGSIAGVVRTPLPRFFVATLFGQLGYVLASYYFGTEIAGFTDRFLVWLEEHVVATTLVCAGAVAVQVLLRMQRKARERKARRAADTPPTGEGG